jgi:coenzyme F420-reducing hydrogenase delta subunit
MGPPGIRIIGFCCQNAIKGDERLAGRGHLAFEPTIKIVHLPCSSKVDTLPIMKAFESGADGIFVLRCPEHVCRLLDGNLRAKKIVRYTRGLLEDIGIESNRLEIFEMGTPECPDFGHVATTMTERIETLGKAQ